MCRYAEAADKGVARAVKAGCKAPLLFFSCKDPKRFPEAGLVSVLGAMKALYVPLETREQVKERAKKVDKLGVFGNAEHVERKLTLARALEAGRIVSRDIGGSDPERMAAPRVEEYVRRAFDGTGVKIEVLQGQSNFEREYPCFAAVNRAASVISRL